MHKVPPLIVDKILNDIYDKPKYRYLKEVEIDYPVGRGRFKVGETGYMSALGHLTSAEANLCINQLCYVFFGKGSIKPFIKI